MGNTEIKNKRHCLFLVHLHYTDTCDAHVICTLKSRQRKRWEDNIREWTGLEFGKSQRAVGKLDAKSSAVPQRPLRLRDS